MEGSFLYVNTNGVISFHESIKDFTPNPFRRDGNISLIAPYWCDIDTTNGHFSSHK